MEQGAQQGPKVDYKVAETVATLDIRPARRRVRAGTGGGNLGAVAFGASSGPAGWPCWSGSDS